MRAENILLRVKSLTKEYEGFGTDKRKKFKAVSDVSFDIYKGECLALVGESGCGKSTLAKTLLSLHRADAGELWFGDKNLCSLSRAEAREMKKGIQMVFQDPYASLNPRMRVFDIVAEPLLTHRICQNKEELRERIYALLEEVGIGREAALRYPHQFSGGQRQRIGIARALALRPGLLVLDEPVSALDVSIQSQVLNLLKDIQEEKGLSYLFISHDLSVVKFISDRIMIMFLGKLCEIGRTEEIFARPRHPYTRLLLDSIPKANPRYRLSGDLILSGEIPSPMRPPEGCRFHTRCPYARELCREKEPVFLADGEGKGLACHFPL